MKAVNIIVGIATAIILGALINLGIRAFYPEPVSPTYPNAPVAVGVMPCASNDATCIKNNAQIEAQQQAAQDEQQATFNQQNQAYQDQMNVYNKNLFIIANVVGIVMFALGFWLVFRVALASNAVPIGIMIAGLWSIIYGYMRGWGSVDDQLKFFVGLVIAALVIGGSMWLIQRYQKTHEQK
jgi:predicted RND superfamily exporter protein